MQSLWLFRYQLNILPAIFAFSIVCGPQAQAQISDFWSLDPDNEAYIASVRLKLRTGEPTTRDRWAIKITPMLVSKLIIWRNDLGMPWSSVVYEKNLTVEKVYAHELRHNIGALLATDQVLDQFLHFGHRQILRHPEDYPPAYRSDYQLGGQWFDENISHTAGWGTIISPIADCFAWYTAPDYARGSLPAELEEILEKMTRGKHAGMEKLEPHVRKVVPDLLASLEKIQSGLFPYGDEWGPLKESPLAGRLAGLEKIWPKWFEEYQRKKEKN